MKKFRFKLKKIWIILTAIALFMLTLYFVLTIISGRMAQSIPESHVVEKWSPDSSQYSYTSCFISENYKFSENEIYSMRSSIDTALQNASVKKNEEYPDSRLWIDAYSAEDILTVSSADNSSSLEVSATFCGGDFFYFHDFTYKSGYCFSSADINSDRVVIDENTAWKIFGAFDVEGMEMNICGKTFQIAGVVESRTDKISKLTYGTRNRIYLPYSTAEMLLGDKENIAITCYEMLIPSPVSKFGYKTICEQFPENSADVAVIENSSRFSDFALIDVMKQYGSRSIVTKYIAYPYWENSARVIEDKLAFIMFFRIPLLIIPILYAIVAVIIIILKYRIRSRDCIKFAENIIDIHRKKVYYKNNMKEGVNNEKN